MDIFLASLVVMLASLVGVIAVWRQLGTFIERNLSLLVSFSAGVFLLVAATLTLETLEHAATPELGVLWIVLGGIAVFAVFKLLPAFHHHHDEHAEQHAHSSLDARRILVSDALHNIGDGILLAAAFSVSGPLGWLTAASVFIHELVQEISEFFVLRSAGYSTRKALSLNFLVSGTILIGAVGGYFLLDLFEQLETPLLGLAAGAFFVVVAHDLVPHSVRASETTARYDKHLLAFFLGLLLMWGVNALIGHAHEQDVHDHESHEKMLHDADHEEHEHHDADGH